MSQHSLFTTADAISVGTLHRRAKNALARDFRGPIWVEGEIKQHKEMRGNLFLNLIEPGDYSDGSDISVEVAVWSQRHAVLKAQLRDAGVQLTSGMVVRVRATVSMSKTNRLQLVLVDLDTDAMVGRAAAEKQRLVQALRADGAFEAQRRLIVPLVPLRVVLVTSQNSEGHNDFVGQLDRSPFGFAVQLVHSPVQGPSAPGSLARAITPLAARTDLDVVCVVRGGGGELDAFDKEPVARAIAASPLPVWTGVGHTGDRAIADDVAQQSFITPTECGQALVRAVEEFHARVRRAARAVSRVVEHTAHAEAARVTALADQAVQVSRRHAQRCAALLETQADRARRSADRDLALAAAELRTHASRLAPLGSRALAEPTRALTHVLDEVERSGQRRQERTISELAAYAAQLRALDPARPLQRGYSFTRTADGSLVRDASTLAPGTELVTQFGRGSASSTVTAVEDAP